jgi:NADH-quinone oxidoreductase subunit E
MIPESLKSSLKEKIATVDHPREMVVDVIFAIQEHYGHLTDEGVEETARLVGMSPRLKWSSWRLFIPSFTASRWENT